MIHRLRLSLVAIVAGLGLAGPAMAADSNGTISEVSETSLSVRTDGGRTVTFALTPDWIVLGLDRLSLSELKPGADIITQPARGPDGSASTTVVIEAQREALCATVWICGADREPVKRDGGQHIDTLVRADPRSLTLRDGDGRIRTVSVPDTAQRYRMIVGERGLLQPGVSVFVAAPTQNPRHPSVFLILAGMNGVIVSPDW